MTEPSNQGAPVPSGAAAATVAAPVRVTGKDGLRGYLEPVSSGVTPSGDSAPQEIGVVHLDTGRTVTVPLGLLVPQTDMTFFLPLSLEDVERAQQSAESQESLESAEGVVIPVVAEQIVVGTRLVETGRVRVRTHVQEREEVVDEPLERQSAVVETVPIYRLIEGPAPAVRQEGDVFIVPVIEEILVVEKRLRLKEEIRIYRKRQTIHEPQTVTLRHQEVSVERINDSAGANASPSAPNTAQLLAEQTTGSPTEPATGENA